MMIKHEEFDTVAATVMAMPLQLRLTLLTMLITLSIVEANRTTRKIAKAMLGVLTTMSRLHDTAGRFEIAEMFRDHADLVERPALVY